MENKVNFSIPVIRVSQKEKSNQAIFSGKVKLRDIYEKNKERFNIHVWKDEQDIKQKGYQRSPNPRAIDKIIDYMQSETLNPLFPTSILVSCRQELEFKPIKEGSDIGELKVTDTLWIIDGQHRTKAFKKMMEHPDIRDEFGDYEVPIVVMTGFNIPQEIEQFFIINSRQRKVETGLAQQIYLSLAIDNFETKIIPQKGRWMLYAVKIAGLLRNDEDFTNGIWAARIELPNEDKYAAKMRLISQNSFVSSLKPFFVGAKAIWPENPANEKRGNEIVKQGSELIYKFWNTVKKVYPIPFNSPKEYSLFNTVGVFSMHLLLINIIDQNKSLDNINRTLEIVEEKLKIAKEGDFGDGFWRRGNKIAIQKGRNAGAFSSSSGQKTIANKIFFGESLTE